MTRALTILAGAAVLGGLALALTGVGLIPGLLLVLLGLGLGVLSGALYVALRVRASAREWRALLSDGGPESVRIVAVEPPPGFLLNREATITLEVRGQDGTAKRIRRGLPIPPPQALLWRLAGRVPTPIGRLTDARELDLAVYRKRR